MPKAQDRGRCRLRRAKQNGGRANRERIVDEPSEDAHNAYMACRWSSDRRPFNAVSFGNNRLIECTDGYLITPHTLEVFAVVEVKAMIRDREQHPEVLWQEAAEMVAWIMSDVNSRQCPLERRIIVSQARDEIYITIANYDQECLDYLQGRFNPRRYDRPEFFLRMTEYGPWKIDSRSNMHHLARVIMAFCLQVTDDINQLRGSPGQSTLQAIPRRILLAKKEHISEEFWGDIVLDAYIDLQDEVVSP
ncbi:hypothetical protein N7489_000154 [Penicillium chrysogenum]|uniref:Uncharacterized protein n=1 Tax=Penicillium chrysogenum TaxID=5076 RepID=A0ABQ8WFJ0_PENCH|nr:uncharacterized protein N7489_000154 [Penicillium chrysogenum]KAJ5249744.1 hypothetical protein N7489_000154 [Penicillium chrysogenum]KAJ5265335.1 hypothetical protein N7524_006353 [Penicillium chrysogenum]KAJ5268648.1 hypothetical protein N7505_004406 [Penicillium chrysogenum]